ncbi:MULTISPECIES: hypothetical protein [Pseudomonas]|jgi:hypothetical protein|uniref:Secreted protein n=10 Tax=Gammaproteobacteria TaxID=1236 RepID=Q9HVE9_PSEAE|nr:MULTISPECIES: hypothetical protein [Pseudomonas]NP_253332.1 hypothetical protein PA4643 [Pseudomonas aeruginosa PAO1]AID82800.1 hypothetical protein P797_04805 [Pseudomonas aeruginosa VRFPA04]EAZ56058.1 hypothetical protein PACG_04771 [Pseudomonas aeruginosa C3719]EQL42410.1 hypothetical protein M770_04290 [Pseudomonas aeruginosa VRFPA03]ESR67812.1 hypothetical protein T266_29170 [Pseudomonas aeruginosa VRFPA05]ETU83523.1 hypothetical protein Q053_04525 [Pseudomonas aeruginosa BWHPSA048]E
MFARSLCGSLLLFVSLAGLAAENPPMHARFLPPDDGQLRQEAPEQQQLIQITEYSVVLGNQRQSNQQPIPITTPTLLRLKGKPLSKGATLAQVLIQFDSEGKSLKKPVYDAGTRTLTLNYPLAQYPALLDLLRNQTVYCQFLAYPNGHVWADLHTGAVRAR